MARIEMSSTEIQRDWSRVQTHLDEGDEVVVVRYSRPIAVITAYPQEATVNTTTDYGTWHNLTGAMVSSIEDSICGYLNEFEDDYDVEAIVADYRNAVDAVLPGGVTIHGEGILYGPYPRPGWWMDDDSEEWQELREAVEAIDLDAIAERHDTARG